MISPFLVLTTLPHYYAMVPAILANHHSYAVVVFASSTLSVIWHSTGHMMELDYTLAVVWCMYDVYLSWKLGILLNLIVFLTNLFADTHDAHCAWHILSWSRAIAFSIYIFRDPSVAYNTLQ
jgi:hypothetical protein